LCNENVGIEKLTLDHIIPLTKAPKNYVYDINNVQPLCARCNSKKSDKIK
jgi:5-methylcytosine-specific restriction endonuclease McrA